MAKATTTPATTSTTSSSAIDMAHILREAAELLMNREAELENLRYDVSKGRAEIFTLMLATEKAKKLTPALADLTKAILS